MGNTVRKPRYVEPANTLNEDTFFDASTDAMEMPESRGDLRLGQPIRVCVVCGEEDPSRDSTTCLHNEVAVFAEATKAILDAVDRLQSTMSELSRRRKALSAVLRSATQNNEAVVDRFDDATPGPLSAALGSPATCERCEERDAQERIELAIKQERKASRRAVKRNPTPPSKPMEPTQFALEFSPSSATETTVLKLSKER